MPRLPRTVHGLLFACALALPGTRGSSAPPSAFFECAFVDAALSYLGSPPLAPPNASANASWCCGLDMSSGNSRRTVTCAGAAAGTNGSATVTELWWTNSGLNGTLADLTPSWLPSLKVLNLAGNPGLTGPFPTFLVRESKSLVYLNLEGSSIHGSVPDLSYQKLEYLYLRGTRLRSQVVLPSFMRQCFLVPGVDSMCFQQGARIPPACAATGAERCPSNTTLPTAPPALIEWKCIDGYNTPVRLVSDGADLVPACMTMDGKSCVFTATPAECDVLAATPLPNAIALTCGQMFADVYGASGYSYSPRTWCTAAFYSLASPAVIRPWPFSPHSQNYTCLPGIHTPLTIIHETGETGCMLAPRTPDYPPGCLWMGSQEGCEAVAKAPPAGVDVNDPFSCGNWYREVYGWDGYNASDPHNWCSLGRSYLYVNQTDMHGNVTLFPTATTTTITSISIPTVSLTGTGSLPQSPYFCVQSVNTPIRVSPNGVDVACMSMDGYLCYWLPNSDSCQLAAGKGDSSTSYLSCGADYDAKYGTKDGGYTPGSWCTIGRAALLGV
ncbi:hypothetical protein DFJ74DRAFT_653545 [Hyaloraphidium curvatum]|nr:hypothetical protein DFJ74DRAFT_653545 [Hyaloraphidium curvatum]